MKRILKNYCFYPQVVWYKDFIVRLILITVSVWYLSMATILLFSSGCITNSVLSIAGTVRMQSAEDNEMATKKDSREKVDMREGLNFNEPVEKKGTIKKLLDWWF